MATAQLTLQKKGRLGTGAFIKQHLLERGSDYVWRSYKAFCEKLKQEGQTPPRYETFRQYIYCLAKLGLIEFDREEPAKTTNAFNRRYYRLVKRNLQSKDWENPRAALDMKEGRVMQNPTTGATIALSQLGKRRYSRWVKHVPPKAAGRPRKPMGMD
jgi:hypothetical protein